MFSLAKKKKETNPDIFYRPGTNKQNHGCITSDWMQQVTECCCSEVVSLYKQQKKRQKEIFLDLKCDRLCVRFFLILLFTFIMGVLLLYNDVVVSAVKGESALCMRKSPLC